MEEKIYIRYLGNGSDDSIIPFNELGQSLIGLDKSVQHLARILRIECNIELKARATSEGSYIVDSLVQFGGEIHELFSNLDHYLEFAKLCGDQYWKDAVGYFNSVEHAQNTLNDYFSKRPLDLALAIGSLTYLLKKLGIIGKKQKVMSDEDVVAALSDELPERITRELLKLLKKKSLYRAILPVIEDVAKSIEIDTDRAFKNPVKIDQSNYQDYLSEGDKILPEYEDGQTYAFDGEITSIKSTRGDSMTFHLKTDGEEYNLDLYPESGLTTKSYLDFYREDVHLFATVSRTSEYKKPKLRVFSIEYNQKRLDIPKKDDSPENS